MKFINIFDNRLSNALDFKDLMSHFLRSHECIERILRDPKLSVKKIQPVTEDDLTTFDSNLKSLENLYFTKAVKANLNPHWEIGTGVCRTGQGIKLMQLDGNGSYFVPTALHQKPMGINDNDFARIYIGLHPSKLFEFFTQLESLLASENVSYYFKFYSVRNNSSDRAVIYMSNKSIFKILEAIKTIKNNSPSLFQGAVNKLFTVEICNGVGLSGDLGYSFTYTFAKYIKIFIAKIIQQYPLITSNIDDIIINDMKHIKNAPESIKDAKKLTIDINTLNFDRNRNFYLDQIKPFIIKSLRDLKNGKAEYADGRSQYITIPNGQRIFYEINLPAIYISLLPTEQRKEIKEKLTSILEFQKLTPEIAKELRSQNYTYAQPLSKNNVAYFVHEFSQLEKLYKEYYSESSGPSDPSTPDDSERQ